LTAFQTHVVVDFTRAAGGETDNNVSLEAGKSAER
jgi:hypothetical protein